MAARFLVLITIAAGWAVIGPPATIRLQRLDDGRSGDLERIASTIRLYQSSHKTLPEGLERLQEEAYLGLSLKDAETGAPYEFRRVDASSYELCATFSLASDGGPGPVQFFRKHPRGRYCFMVPGSDKTAATLNGPYGVEEISR
jgi:hypothetical protein